MKRLAMVIAAGLILAAGVARADDHPQMDEAKKDLQAAKTALQAAGHDYGGHRKQAIESIDKALAHVNQGLQTVDKKENKVEHKEQKAENKASKAQQKVDDLKAKQQQMQTH
jgi:uncharacterized protein (DUF3084 family)